MTVDKKDFWEKKIIGWEDGRYNLKDDHINFLENLGDKSSSSLFYRQKICLEILKDKVYNKDIVELGWLRIDNKTNFRLWCKICRI